LKTEYYLNFFERIIGCSIVLILINIFCNISTEDCGLKSMRGFAAGLITICILASYLLWSLLNFMVNLYDRLNSYLKSRFGWAITSG